jgi:thymidylate synthase (FAD)
LEVDFIVQSHKILHTFGGVDTIAEAARTCYLSEPAGADADERLVRRLIRNGHDAMLEFAWMVVRITCDRGISHEIVRHRLFSFAQESQRYVNYDGRGIRFILPETNNEGVDRFMRKACERGAREYAAYVESGVKPELARYVLPNATATTLVVGGNVREWRHFFRLRCDRHAHPMMQDLARGILADAKAAMPVVFDDIEVDG